MKMSELKTLFKVVLDKGQKQTLSNNQNIYYFMNDDYLLVINLANELIVHKRYVDEMAKTIATFRFEEKDVVIHTKDTSDLEEISKLAKSFQRSNKLAFN